jgi:hypothetical protein
MISANKRNFMNPWECRLKPVSDFDLARAIMQRLWWIYDGGGISMHRAERASLLESITDCVPIEWRADDDVDVERMIEEAMCRSIPEPVLEEEFFTELHLLPRQLYACLVFEEMSKWYAQDPMVEVIPGTFVSRREKQMVDAIVHLLNAKKTSSILTSRGHNYGAQQLIQDGWERRREVIWANSEGVWQI